MAQPPHGEIARYSSGCRCDECKSANAAYQRDYRKGIRYTRKRWRKEPEHGTEAKYQRGCRCDRCAKAASYAQHVRQIKNRHGMSAETYQAILDFQSESCALCDDSFNNGERLSIDHKHSCPHAPGKSCRMCWRGLLCRSCNGQLERLIGHAYINEVEGVASSEDLRVLSYVRNPPAQQVLAGGVEPPVRPSESQN